MNNFYDDAEKVLKRLDDSVALIVAQMKLGGKLDPEDVFFDNQQFMKLMNISKRTAQEWRNKKIIEFSQVGNKIYYRLSDIQKLLNDNYNPK
jgi:ABC-type polysaccharide/polyol phosphate transport system ATPase subunit